MIDEKTKRNIKIQFPNLLLIPILAMVGSVIKLCGGTESDWLEVILLFPCILYFIWSFGFVVLSLLSILVANLMKGKKK